MPGAFEGETVTRRRFMEAVTHGAGGIAAAAFTLPALGFAIGPLFSREPFNWQPIGYPDDFTKNLRDQGDHDRPGDRRRRQHDRLRAPARPGDRHQRSNQYNQFVALSSRCMHLGCPVRYVPPAQRFICPCHGGVYDFSGQVVGGPPVRPLDRFYTRVHKRPGRDRPALLGQLPVAGLLAARSRPAAQRHRPVPVPEAVRHLDPAAGRAIARPMTQPCPNLPLPRRSCSPSPSGRATDGR